MRSGLLWFLPTFCPHFKIIWADFLVKSSPDGLHHPSVCLGFVSPGSVDLLTSNQLVDGQFKEGGHFPRRDHRSSGGQAPASTQFRFAAHDARARGWMPRSTRSRPSPSIVPTCDSLPLMQQSRDSHRPRSPSTPNQAQPWEGRPWRGVISERSLQG